MPTAKPTRRRPALHRSPVDASNTGPRGGPGGAPAPPRPPVLPPSRGRPGGAPPRAPPPPPPGTVGPWLSVSVAVADAAGALVVEDLLSARTFDMLFGPWQQAIGRLQPVGPGALFTERTPALRGTRGG